jgi:hypothetical protein
MINCHENTWDWLSNITQIAHFHDLWVPQGGMSNCAGPAQGVRPSRGRIAVDGGSAVRRDVEEEGSLGSS